MSVSYFVLYKGSADDPAGFADRYRTVHVPILLGFPGIRRVSVHEPIPSKDPQSVQPSAMGLIAEMRFDSAEALEAALRSEARVRAREDFHAFPPFRGEVLHQAMRTEDFA